MRSSVVECGVKKFSQCVETSGSLFLETGSRRRSNALGVGRPPDTELLRQIRAMRAELGSAVRRGSTRPQNGPYLRPCRKDLKPTCGTPGSHASSTRLHNHGIVELVLVKEFE